MLRRILLPASALVPILLLLHSSFVSPRPYYVTEIDIEQDYYYNSLVLSHGGPVASIHHPGTPVYLLGSALLALSGRSPADTQRFFWIAYLLVAVASAGALVTFMRMALVEAPPGVAVLALASVVAWPSFLTYQNLFGSESLVVALGLPTVVFFWRALDASNPRSERDLFLCGIGAGACLATKMTFITLFGALLFGSSVHLLRVRVRRDAVPGSRGLARARRTAARLLAFPLGAALSYLLLTAPILPLLPTVWLNTLHRREALPPASGFVGSLLSTFGLIPEANFPFAVLIVGVMTAFLVVIVRSTHRRLREGPVARPQRAASDFDAVAGGIFLSLLLAGFLYTLAASSVVTVASENPGVGPGGADPGVRLRNVSPSALVLPFLVLFCWRMMPRIPDRMKSRMLPSACLFLGLTVIVWGFWTHLSFRRAFLERHIPRIAATRARLQQLQRPGTRIGFWTGGSTDYLGDISFHSWGNYRYARGRFDHLLLRHYPDFTFFSGLREIARGRLTETTSKEDGPRYKRHRLGWIADVLRWNRSLGLPERRAGLFVGEDSHERIALIAVPQAEADVELGSRKPSDFLAGVRLRIGEVQQERGSIAGTEWLLLEVQNQPASASNSGY